MALLFAVPAGAMAQSWNQKAYNNSQAAQKSQQHYNQQTGRR
ncbi:hypothetical protein [Methylocella sp. CPCC 101449]|nr:hypothetical protein [Methylocella sp. CPCC 101449]MDT2021263.1 hypothetical protein [Methylocella sp. CPCC 101449]